MRFKTVTAIVLATTALVTGGNAFAQKALASKAYQCQELRQLVAEKERVYLKGLLGSKSTVYASASSCNYIHELAYKSAWRTSDVRSCVVGYRCISKFSTLFGGGNSSSN